MMLATLMAAAAADPAVDTARHEARAEGWLILGTLVVCLLGILAIGAWVSRGVKKEADFYLGGRKLGRPLQFFLTFGNMTDSNGAPMIASEVFRQGAGGVITTVRILIHCFHNNPIQFAA